MQGNQWQAEQAHAPDRSSYGKQDSDPAPTHEIKNRAGDRDHRQAHDGKRHGLELPAIFVEIQATDHTAQHLAGIKPCAELQFNDQSDLAKQQPDPQAHAMLGVMSFATHRTQIYHQATKQCSGREAECAQHTRGIPIIGIRQ
jgi:hypothetical protein